jgi:hypothetical protein
MDWTPKWESLADALERVTKHGTSRDIAKGRICTDIAQDRIRLCPYVASETRGNADVRLRYQRQYRVPPRLEPADFDWENSCPLQPWSVNREGRSDYGWEAVEIKFIELDIEDVTDRLCNPANASSEKRAVVAHDVTAAECEASFARPSVDKKELERQAKDVVEREMAKSGGFVSQENGARAILKVFPGFGRDRGRDLTKALTRNDKRGPRGPRKNSAVKN